MDIKKLQALVIDALEDVKAQEIRVYDTTHLTSMFDRIAIASGTSNRQTKALASSVRDKVKAAGGDIVNMEGEGTGEWVLVDLGDMVVHIMQPAIRAYYRLEEIWGDKEVKFGAAKRTGARKTAAADEDDEEAKPARKAPAKKAAAKTASKTATKTVSKSAAGKTASKTTAKSATKSASKTTAAKTPRKTATKVVVKTAAAKTPAKKAAAKKTAAKKAAPKKPAAKSAARKTV